MYVAVITVIGGQSLRLASARVLMYAVLVRLTFHLFVLSYEAPMFRDGFHASLPGSL